VVLLLFLVGENRVYAQEMTGPPDGAGTYDGVSELGGHYVHCHVRFDDSRAGYWANLFGSCQYGPTSSDVEYFAWRTNDTSGLQYDYWVCDTLSQGQPSCAIGTSTGSGGRTVMVTANSQGMFQFRLSRIAPNDNSTPISTMPRTGTAPYTEGADVQVESIGIRKPGATFSVAVGSSFPVYPVDYWPGGHNPNPTVSPGQEMGGVRGSHAVNPSFHWGDPVNTATGNLSVSLMDASLPGIGIPFSFTRAYNSLDTSQSVMGPGWTFSYNVFLTVDGSNNATLHAEDGQQVLFTYSGGTYTPDPGVRDTLVKNADDTYTLMRHDGVKYAFDVSGRITSEKDLNNQGLTFSYAGSQLTQITDSVGRSISLSYTGGLLTRLLLPDGRSVAYSYQGGLLWTVTDLRGNSINYRYDASSRLNTIIDQDNRTVAQVLYGADGRVSQFTDGRQNTSYFSWDPTTQTETVTDNRGKTWKQTYTNGVLVSFSDPVTGEVIGVVFDEDLNLTLSTTVGNNTGNSTIQYKYDANGNLIEEDDPEPTSYVKNWTFNSFNETTSFTDGRNPRRTTRWEYDANGNLTCELLANAPTGVATCAQALQDNKITYAYDPSGTGLLFSRTDPNNHTVSYGYDSKGNLSSITGPPTPAAPQGSLTTMTYDSGGRLQTRVDPRGNVPGADPTLYTWTYAFSNTNQLTSVQDPLGGTTTYHFNLSGTVKDIVNPRQFTTRYEYDGNNNLTCVLYPNATVTVCANANQTKKATFGYDPNNNPTSRTDGNNHTWTFGYDDANRLHTATSPTPLQHTWTYEYYPDGLLKQKTLPSGNVTYTYDQLSRLTGIAYSDTPTTPNVTFGYDGADNRIWMTDVGGNLCTASDGSQASVCYDYDDLNRPTSVARGTDTFSYQYWPGSQPQQVTYPDSSAVSYAYYADNSLHTATVGSDVTTFTYDPAGNTLTKALPSSNGYVATFTYDYAGRLTSLTNAKNGSTLSSFNYTGIDGDGNPTQIVTNSETQNYTYDAFDRIATACYPGCSGAGKKGFAYTFDPAANITSRVVYTPSATTTSTYAYDEEDRLCWVYAGTSSNPCATPPSGATLFSFQANGNESQAGSRSFTWDLENRLVTTTSGSTTHSYTYDGEGNRIKDSWGAGASSNTNYLWDLNAQLPRLAMERNGNNNTLRTYTYDDGLMAMKSAGMNFYYLADPLGSVANLTSSSGATQWTYTYEPFGAARSITKNDPAAPTNLMRFDGQLIDPVDNQYDLRARMYDPATGRFLQRDPLPAPRCQQQVGSYVYAADRPTVLDDPSGMDPELGVVGWSARFGLPLCTNVTFPGTIGETIVQVDPLSGVLRWRINTYAASLKGDWYVIEHANGRVTNVFDRPYPPHGSLPPSVVPHGSIFGVFGESWLQIGPDVIYATGDHQCVVP
jgi:RHS repeat-associated protein